MAKPLLARTEDLATLTGKPADDARLALALKRASGRFYGDAERESILLTAEPVTEHYNGDGSDTILLRGAPVVGELTISTPAGYIPVGFELDRNAGILRAPGGFPRGLGNIAVTYRHGYEEIPEDIEDAVLEHAATIASVMAHLQQEGGGSTQASYAKEATVGTTAKWVATVNRYRLQGRA